ncbi:MAG: hypothetical protein EPN97_03880 [Alphaproteobacteria bacterium]|nr:MAG: hypothetical protein EPN97_03880 [Alphaproteobacteria bacterium]
MKKKEVAELLERAKAMGDPEVISRVEAKQAEIDKQWEFVDGVARALTAQQFKDFLSAEGGKTAKAHADASVRAEKETELYRRLLKNTTGPERESVVKDISSYAEESAELRKTFCRDGMIVSVDAAVKSAVLVAEGWGELSHKMTDGGLADAGNAMESTVPYVNALKTLGVNGHYVSEAVHDGKSFQEATDKDDKLGAMLEAAKAAGKGTLRAAELLAESPDNPVKQAMMREAFGTAAARAGIYINLLTLGLDTGMIYAAASRLKDAEARQLQVETDDARWRGRVESAARVAKDAGAREERAKKQIENQQRFAELYQKIKAESGQ